MHSAAAPVATDAEPVAAEAGLAPLARVAPWPAVSGLIGYGGRLWFTNSVKYVNHNSADLYSYDPGSGRTRFERHLFSQDADAPAVHRGLLYWPFEDSRWSAGRAEFAVTDGTSWRWSLLPEGRAFHLQAMAEHDGALYAATSAWRARLQRSRDGGASWEILYEHDTPEGGVSRILSLASFGGRLYAGLVARYTEGVDLLRWQDGTFRPLAGWPRGQAVTSLTPWRGHLYAVNSGPGGSAVWRTDGIVSERIDAFGGRFVRDLAAGPDALWAITVGDGNGALWRSADGRRWRRAQDFEASEPADLAVFGGRPFVGTIGRDAGCLWGPPGPLPVPTTPAPAPLPEPRRPLDARALGATLAELDRLLAGPDSFRSDRSRVSEALSRLALARSPEAGAALAARLARPYPRAPTRLIGGSLTLPTEHVVRWALLRAMALTGHGRVPPALLAEPWTQQPNRAEKYFQLAAGAAWAASWLGQADDETIGALIDRLGRPGDPLWLTGDLTGALSALTGRRLGYDVEAWRQWWRHRDAGGTAADEGAAGGEACRG